MWPKKVAAKAPISTIFFVVRQIASGVRFRRQKPQIRPFFLLKKMKSPNFRKIRKIAKNHQHIRAFFALCINHFFATEAKDLAFSRRRRYRWRAPRHSTPPPHTHTHPDRTNNTRRHTRHEPGHGPCLERIPIDLSYG